jgi:hypothetical protein
MDKNRLQTFYLDKKLSAKEISKICKCSEHKVNYWIEKYNIKKRTIAEAAYQWNNPNGDPFSFAIPENMEDMFLFGLGLGLFWGEGTKKDKHAVRLCNSDPALIKKFLEFLIKVYNIDRNKLQFQLQIYDDLDEDKLLTFWTKYLSVGREKFHKTTILKRRGEGTYLHKMRYGVVIVYFNNIKLRNLICGEIANMQTI